MKRTTSSAFLGMVAGLWSGAILLAVGKACGLSLEQTYWLLCGTCGALYLIWMLKA